MIFLRDSFCLSAVSLSRQRHDILDFSYCPLSRVLYVTLANGQGFGFEFDLRSLIWGHHHLYWVGLWISVDQLITSQPLHSLLHRADETQQGRNSCPRLQFLAFSLDFIMSLPRYCFLRSISLASLFTKIHAADCILFNWIALLFSSLKAHRKRSVF